MMPTDEEILNTGEETNLDLAAADPTGEPQTPIETPAAGETQEPVQETKNVPLASLEDERRKRQAAEQQLQQYQQYLIQQQAMQQATQSAPSRPPVDVLEQIGISPDDIYTPEGVRRFATGVNQLVAKQVEEATRQFKAQMETQTFQQQATDYADLVGQPGPFGFQPAPALQRALQDNPDLEREIASMSDPIQQRRTAYRFAKMAKRIIDLESAQADPRDVATAVRAKTAPMSPAATGSGGAFTLARDVGRMSDEEFDKLDRQAAGG